MACELLYSVIRSKSPSAAPVTLSMVAGPSVGRLITAAVFPPIVLVANPSDESFHQRASAQCSMAGGPLLKLASLLECTKAVLFPSTNICRSSLSSFRSEGKFLWCLTNSHLPAAKSVVLLVKQHTQILIRKPGSDRLGASMTSLARLLWLVEHCRVCWTLVARWVFYLSTPPLLSCIHRLQSNPCEAIERCIKYMLAQRSAWWQAFCDQATT
ncbi:hypothetical protein Bbelb_042590 [Branchiostoma belcheri]|nr:hypothetical protein Bbelb_042590 [Branchiostoma belcheri]